MADPLATWVELNEVMQSASEDFCKELLKVELKHRKRKIFVLRIHSRLNKLRAHRERKELLAKIK